MLLEDCASGNRRTSKRRQPRSRESRQARLCIPTACLATLPKWPLLLELRRLETQQRVFEHRLATIGRPGHRAKTRTCPPPKRRTSIARPKQLGSSFCQCAFERMGPGVAEWFNRTVDHCAPLMFDAERTVAGDLADLVRRHFVLSRSCENGGKRRRLDRYHRASAAFVEEGVFGGDAIIESDNRAENGRGKPRPYRGRGETGFGKGDSEAAVGDVVGGLDGAFGSESDETVDQKFFGGEIDGGWFASNDAASCLRIFAR